MQPQETYMKHQRTVGLLSLATICLLSSAPGRAALVTYQATGTIDQADNTAQFPGALATAAVGNALSVDFTIDTNSVGSLNGPGDASYLLPVVSANASVGFGKVALGVDFSTVEISSDTLAAGIYSTNYQLLSIGSVPANFTGVTSSFGLITGASGALPLSIYKDTSLNNAPLQPSFANLTDGLGLVFTSYVDGVSQSQSDVFVSSNMSIARINAVAAPEMDSASAVGSLTLLLGSLAVMSGRRIKA
jgi:hypothetical protein